MGTAKVGRRLRRQQLLQFTSVVPITIYTHRHRRRRCRRRSAVYSYDVHMTHRTESTAAQALNLTRARSLLIQQ